MKGYLLSAGIGVLALTACAPSTDLVARQAGDESMSCHSLSSALTDARQIELGAIAQREVSGSNAATAIFFWPALLDKYSKAADTIDTARDRQAYLDTLYSQKGCGSFQVSDAQAEIDLLLRQFRSMYEEGLLSEEEYLAARETVPVL